MFNGLFRDSGMASVCFSSRQKNTKSAAVFEKRLYLQNISDIIQNIHTLGNISQCFSDKEASNGILPESIQ